MNSAKPIRALIAEDDFLVSQGIIYTLKDIGYQPVGIARDGEKAVKMTLALNPDVVLMDIKMPNMNGLTASKKIQASHPTPIVILTAYDSPKLIKDASISGVSAFLTKPPTRIEIERTITIALARHNDLLELKQLNIELKKSIDELNALPSILPICMTCKKIRNHEGDWEEIEGYINRYTKAQFSHGICPECQTQFYQDYLIKHQKNNDE
jgi:AmiR/NasT family two-component response regulator